MTNFSILLGLIAALTCSWLIHWSVAGVYVIGLVAGIFWSQDMVHREVEKRFQEYIKDNRYWKQEIKHRWDKE